MMYFVSSTRLLLQNGPQSQFTLIQVIFFVFYTRQHEDFLIRFGAKPLNSPKSLESVDRANQILVNVALA